MPDVQLPMRIMIGMKTAEDNPTSSKQEENSVTDVSRHGNIGYDTVGQQDILFNFFTQV